MSQSKLYKVLPKPLIFAAKFIKLDRENLPKVISELEDRFGASSFFKMVDMELLMSYADGCRTLYDLLSKEEVIELIECVRRLAKSSDIVYR